MHGHVGEVAVGGSGQDLEVGRWLRQVGLDGGHTLEHLGQGLVGDGLALPCQALVDSLEMGARVGPHRQSVELQQPGHHAGDARLSVGAGDVEERICPLGGAEQLDHGRDPLEGGGGTPAGEFQVGVPVEPGQEVDDRRLRGLGYIK